jgi:hypothetical protein
MLGYVFMHDMGWIWDVLMTLGWLAALCVSVGVLLAAVRNGRQGWTSTSSIAHRPRRHTTT